MGMKQQNALGMTAMMIAMGATNNEFYLPYEHEEKEPKPIKKIIPKGLKEFFYGTEVVYALNKKNADRKARKLGLIITAVGSRRELLPTDTEIGKMVSDLANMADEELER